MIEAITLKNVATFDEIGVQIQNFKKVNFIYGGNGSGKTTITKFLYNPDDTSFADCSLIWNHGISIKTLIYNKDFRDRNFGKGTIAGVFTLGQATKEEIEAIEKKREEVQLIGAEGLIKRNTLDKQIQAKLDAENNFKEDVWTKIYKKNENDFKEAFKGAMQKESFRNRLLNEFKNNSFDLLSYNKIKEKSDIIFGKIPEIIPLITDISFERLNEIEQDKIWQKKIVGKLDVDIAKLIQKLNLNDWVNEGRTYLQDNICPFCQKETISEEFRKQLEDYFDESFTNDISILKNNSIEYNRLTTSLINELMQTEFSENSKESTKLKLAQPPINWNVSQFCYSP